MELIFGHGTYAPISTKGLWLYLPLVWHYPVLDGCLFPVGGQHLVQLQDDLILVKQEFDFNFVMAPITKDF